MSREREERQKRHLQVMHEFFLAECRDDIAEYQQKVDEAAVQGREHDRRMYERWLLKARASLAREEARQLSV